MALSCGFVGLPNVGKSTLFNALTCGKAAAENFPFCTIEPNTGIVPVPDERVNRLSDLEKSAKKIPATMKFIDIAGLVEGASKGEGLGNQFLSNIRGVDAVAHVVRLFQDPDVTHVKETLDPTRDLDLILTELMLADLDLLQQKMAKSKKSSRCGNLSKEQELEQELTQRFIDALNDGKFPQYDHDSADETRIAKSMQLLTLIPAFVCANTDEEAYKNFGKEPRSQALIAKAQEHGMEVVPVCAKYEVELQELSAEEREVFMSDIGATESGLERVIRTGYRLLNYITFFTTGPDETRAWTVTRGASAPEAAGKIHTDMQRGFIRMEVIGYDDLMSHQGWNAAKEAGKLRIEGKEYTVRDGDCCFVRFSV